MPVKAWENKNSATYLSWSLCGRARSQTPAARKMAYEQLSIAKKLAVSREIISACGGAAAVARSGMLTRTSTESLAGNINTTTQQIHVFWIQGTHKTGNRNLQQCRQQEKRLRDNWKPSIQTTQTGKTTCNALGFTICKSPRCTGTRWWDSRLRISTDMTPNLSQAVTLSYHQDPRKNQARLSYS